jgi:hypothetical protein
MAASLSNTGIKYFKMAVNASEYKTTPLDVSCRCPICGDSTKKRNSKRLHLYRKGEVELINCFNQGCAAENKTVYSFLRDFYPGLLSSYKRETFTNKMEHLKTGGLSGLVDSTIVSNNPVKEALSTDGMSLGEMVSNKTSESPIVEEKEDLPPLMDLKPFFGPLTEDMENYLGKRQVPLNFGGTWYRGLTDIKIGETLYQIKDYLIIPLYYGEQMYGFYSRSILEKDFKTFVTLSGFKAWNYYNIDKKKEVYIFEAIFDAISSGLTNITANLGAKFPKERLDELDKPVFCLDNDKTGIETSIKYALEGHSVYVQPLQYKEKDFNELKLNHPELDISKLITDNIFKGISAVSRLKTKL